MSTLMLTESQKAGPLNDPASLKYVIGSLQLEGTRIQLIILSLRRQQFFMRTAFNDPAMIQNNDHVRILDR